MKWLMSILFGNRDEDPRFARAEAKASDVKTAAKAAKDAADVYWEARRAEQAINPRHRPHGGRL